MNNNKLLKYLYSLESKKFKQNLINMRILLKKIHNPEKKLKIIHVTGTNGKGSVCAMLSSILQDSKYKVGLYTSPHLKKFNERIRINNNLIADKEIIKYYLKLKPYITNQTFFEITTTMALLYFYEKKVDYVILEVGLGGRLDTTNVIKPLVSVITNIGIEHTDYLGNKIEKIAYEKAGIIKKNIPTVTGAKDKALVTIKKIADNRKAPLILNKKHKNLKLDFLKGNFQLENASIAITTIETLNKFYNLKINKNNIKNGLKKAKWPGRFQFIGKNILVDCAHNPDGIKSLIKEIKKLSYNKLILVVGISIDKDIKKIIEMLNPIADYFILTKAKYHRAADPNFISKYVKKEFKIIKDNKKALNFAKKTAKKQDLILVTGSIFLVGEILPNSYA